MEVYEPTKLAEISQLMKELEFTSELLLLWLGVNITKYPRPNNFVFMASSIKGSNIILLISQPSLYIFNCLNSRFNCYKEIIQEKVISAGKLFLSKEVEQNLSIHILDFCRSYFTYVLIKF